MRNPASIQQLEEILETTFKKVDTSDLNNYNKGSTLYSLNPNGTVSGLRIHLPRHEGKIISLQDNEKLFSQLTKLVISYTSLTDFEFLKLSKKLKSLTIEDCNFSDHYLLRNLTELKNLNLIEDKITEFGFLSDLKHLEKLDLSNTEISDISFINCLRHLPKLKNLILNNNKINDISSLHALPQVTELQLKNNNINNLSPLLKLPQLKNLEIANNPIEDISPLKQMGNLKKPYLIFSLEKRIQKWIYNIWNNDLSLIMKDKDQPDACFALDKQGSIVGLRLEELRLKEIPPEVPKMKNLTRLNLVWNNISCIKPLKKLYRLEFLELTHNRIINLWPLKNLHQLKVLYLAMNNFKNIAPLKNLINLSYLEFGVYPQGFVSDLRPLRKLKNLKVLAAGYNRIENISPLKNLINLQDLLLSNNRVKNLPFEVFTELKGIDNWSKILEKNPIQDPPPAIINRGDTAIHAWFEEKRKVSLISSPFVKLIITGNATVGKTSFIKFLTDQSFYEKENTTHGINHYIWKPLSTNLSVNIWDFGGQEYYHSTHQLFFSNNALYLLMYDKKHNHTGWLQTKIHYFDRGYIIEKLEHFNYFYWLQSIRSLTEHSKILMLQNKVEHLEDEEYPENICFRKDKEYRVEKPFKSISVLNEYKYYQENNGVSKEFKEIQKLIISKLNDIKHGKIFEYYLEAKKLIEVAAKKKPVVSIEEFIEICSKTYKNIGKIIVGEDGYRTQYPAWKLLCIYFHETGSLLYYPDSPVLCEKIFIRPTYVTSTIYKVLNYEVKKKFGHFTLEDVIKSLNNNIKLANDIIELMSIPNFKLIFNFPFGTGKYIAPQYLNENRPHIHHAVKKMEVRFVLEFTQYLSKSILTEFMVDYGRFHINDTIWKYGIVFEKYGTTAFVECYFKAQKIIYKSDGAGEFNKLMYEVFESLRKINRNDNNMRISLDSFFYYSLENVLNDLRNDQFKNFRLGYKNFRVEDSKIYKTIINGNIIKVEGNGNIILQNIEGGAIDIRIKDFSKNELKFNKTNSEILLVLKDIQKKLHEIPSKDLQKTLITEIEKLRPPTNKNKF